MKQIKGLMWEGEVRVAIRIALIVTFVMLGLILIEVVTGEAGDKVISWLCTWGGGFLLGYAWRGTKDNATQKMKSNG